MCILFIAVNQHPDYPLIIAANRDEFHKRPTQASHFWHSNSHVLAGKDIQAGGTWMGITTSGRVAALTNIRAPGEDRPLAVTRGELVSNFLLGSQSNREYATWLDETHMHYNGYNLLFGNLTKLQVFNNFERKIYQLNDGVYGLSNASLNSPWPKLDAGKSALANYCRNAGILKHEHLFELLKNEQAAKDEDLPQTGIPFEWEKKLSSIFIKSQEYGTRSSTLLKIDNHNEVYWEERTFDTEAKEIDRKQFNFLIASAPE